MKRVWINKQIRAKELRVIGDNKENLGVLSLEDALAKAMESGLDLIEIVPDANPPVAKIMDYGKFQYQEKKKEKEANKKAHVAETKSIKIGIATSQHDLEQKAKKISEFLKQKDRVKIDLFLRGRAKYMDDKFKKERLERIFEFVSEGYKVADGPKKAPRGMTVTIEPAGGGK